MRHRVGSGVFPWQRLGMQRAPTAAGNSSTGMPVITGGVHALRSEDLFGTGPLGVIATLPTLEEGRVLHGLSREGSGRVASCG
ncbi:hypothetical protein NET03_10555 [Thermomicrobium sp. CFH 73360]|uniref:hypothetical protein n=1 Tax=Thermomicrobium sp. CFH 73360 TaxID=2951987 RepID=UPI002076F32E|nr:hypothetical protein [Thermomicrobium sp. CFH 73360]MCM8746964.1 hypothetical protein [Thermomicrobium sp. CFH 73360]